MFKLWYNTGVVNRLVNIGKPKKWRRILQICVNQRKPVSKYNLCKSVVKNRPLFEKTNPILCGFQPKNHDSAKSKANSKPIKPNSNPIFIAAKRSEDGQTQFFGFI